MAQGLLQSLVNPKDRGASISSRGLPLTPETSRKTPDLSGPGLGMEARSFAWRRLSWIGVSMTWQWSRSSFKGGVSYGESDELGYKAAVNRQDVHDRHTTILHLLGLDHERLAYFHNGRRYRLTDVSGRVIRGVLE